MFQNSAQVKKNNAITIKKAMQNKGMSTKNDIVKITGLSFATCSNLINEMVRTGEVLICDEMKPNESGRPSYFYEINTEYQLVLGIIAEYLDEGRYLRGFVANLSGEILEEWEEKCSFIEYPQMEAMIRMILEKYAQVSAISVSVQGVVTKEGAVIYADTSELEGINLVQEIEAKFKIATICENDLNVIVYGVSKDQRFNDSDGVAVIAKYKEVPSGSGIVLGGRILHGSTNFAGEVSFITKGEGGNNIDEIVKEIKSIIAVVNPGVVAMIGDSSLQENIGTIRERILEVIPEIHCPELFYIEEPIVYMKQGLIELGLKKMIGESF